MENKNDFIIGKFLIWCIENELWKENVKIEDWLLLRCHLGRNFLEYYFRMVNNYVYETFFIRSYGIGEPWNKISQKSAEYIGVKKNLENRKK